MVCCSRERPGIVRFDASETDVCRRDILMISTKTARIPLTHNGQPRTTLARGPRTVRSVESGQKTCACAFVLLLVMVMGKQGAWFHCDTFAGA